MRYAKGVQQHSPGSRSAPWVGVVLIPSNPFRVGGGYLVPFTQGALRDLGLRYNSLSGNGSPPSSIRHTPPKRSAWGFGGSADNVSRITMWAVVRLGGAWADGFALILQQ